MTRPRVGLLVATDGAKREVSFVPVADQPNVFRAVDEAGRPAVQGNGWTLRVDALAPGQSIVILHGEPIMKATYSMEKRECDTTSSEGFWRSLWRRLRPSALRPAWPPPEDLQI